MIENRIRAENEELKVSHETVSGSVNAALNVAALSLNRSKMSRNERQK